VREKERPKGGRERPMREDAVVPERGAKRGEPTKKKN
jgi:hypothetical protein